MSSIPYEQPNSNYFTRAYGAFKGLFSRPARPVETGKQNYGIHSLMDEAKDRPFFGTLSRVMYAKFRDGHVVKTGTDIVEDLEFMIKHELRRGVHEDATREASRTIWGTSAFQSRDGSELMNAITAYEFVTGKSYDVVRAIEETRRKGVGTGSELAYLPA